MIELSYQVKGQQIWVEFGCSVSVQFAYSGMLARAMLTLSKSRSSDVEVASPAGGGILVHGQRVA